MGNQLAPAAKQGGPLETGELLNVVVKEALGGSRFLKSLLCLHDNGGLVVVKVFYKRKDAGSLVPYKQQLQAIREVLLGLQCPHVWPMQLWWETPNAAYMMRQHFFANLYDRLSTRPFLTALEKRWITFQLLHALSQAHAHGVCHGDIKCENVMVTSWNWLLLVDFASYKPTYLPADNPADFSYYFDTGSRRRCYLAPERFFEGSAAAMNTAAPIQPDMDIFSLGCVIAELWLDGRAFFDLSRLLAYRRGEYDPTAALAGVEPAMAELIMHMIQRSPGERWSADHYLSSWPRQMFPSHFSDVLHPFFNSLLGLESDARLAAVAKHYEELAAAIDSSRSSTSGGGEAGRSLAEPVASATSHSPRDTSSSTTYHQAAASSAAQAPAVAAAAAESSSTSGGSKLLAEVDSLLCDVAAVQRRLGGGVAAVAAEDDGICIDEPETECTADIARGTYRPAATARNIPSLQQQQQQRGTARYQSLPDDTAAAAAAVRSDASSAADAAGDSQAAGVRDAAAAVVGRDQGMVLLAVLLCTLLRGSKLQESKRVAIMLLFRCGLLCDDDVRLQTIVPYLLTQLAAPSAGVRTLALRCAVQLMASLSRLPPADAKVYHDYIVPSLSLLPNDSEELVRVGYAIAAAHLAAAAHGQLLALQFDFTAEPGQGLSATAAAAGVGADRHRIQQKQSNESGSSTPTGAAATAAVGVGDVVDASAAQQYQRQQRQSDGDSSTTAATRQALQQQQHSIRHDAEMAAMRSSLDKAVCDVLTDSRSTADIKRALLSHAHQLGVFFGRRDINNVLLPLLLTVLNAVEWQLRGSFFGAVAALGPHTGRDSLDVFLLPVLEQALVDSEVAVVCGAVSSLATLCHQLRKRSLLKAADKVAPLLQHPSAAVRHSAVACIAAIARVLPPVDVYAQLAVMVADRVQQQPLMLTDEEHLAACLHPISNQQQQQQSPLQQQHSVTTSFKLHQQQQQQQSGPSGLLLSHRASGSKRTSVTDETATGFGSLVTRPAAAAVRHSSSDKLLGSGATGPRTSLSRNVSSSRSLIDASELNLEGSSLTLRPVAPVYCLNIDPAMLGNTAAAAGGIGNSSAAAGNFRNRWGYRLEGFSAVDDSSSSSRGRAAARATPQNASVGPGLVPPGPKDLASHAAAAAAAAAGPGRFWPGPSSGISAYVSNSGSSSGGLLTGLSPGLGVGPGGLVLGSSCVGIGAGLRPRPRSSHTAAVESISKKQAVLQERYESLCEALARDPSGLEASDRQQMERLAATLHRLKLQPGNDVRCAAALLTYKMAAVTSRAGPGGVPGTAGDNSAPAVYDAVSAAISTGIGQHLPGPAGEGMAGAGGPSWRPRGVLASHLQEHRAAVNCLATSANGAILLSASDDETVKVWDIRRLERDVTFASRLTYAGQSGRITGLCPVLDGSSVASGSSSGSLHVWRVDYSSKPGGWAPDKYRGITAVRQLSPGEGSILRVTPWGGHPALLLYASQRGGVHCCDLRCAADVWHVPAAPSLGLAQQLVADPSGQHWLAQGTSRGWVCLWDVRFLLCVNSWQHPQRSGIDAMSLAVAAPPRLGLQQGSLPHPGVPLLYMSAGLQEVGLWDVLDGKCHQVLRALNRQESQLSNFEPPAALQPPLPAAAAAAASNLSSQPPSRGAAAAAVTPFASASQIGGAPGSLDVNNLASELSTHLAIDQINSPQARLGGVTALLPLPGGALLAGGADRCVRYWDGSWPERSYIVTGPVWADDTGIMDPQTNKLQVPAHVHRYSKRMYSGVPVLEECCVGDATRQVMPDSSPDLGSKLRMHELVHADSITQLLAVEGASKLLVSASRDGCIKVWK